MYSRALQLNTILLSTAAAATGRLYCTSTVRPLYASCAAAEGNLVPA